VVLLEVEEVKDVRMPGLQVDGKCSRALVPSLVYIAGSVVVHPQHRDKTI
jgi:hypothetical protein